MKRQETLWWLSTLRCPSNSHLMSCHCKFHECLYWCLFCNGNTGRCINTTRVLNWFAISESSFFMVYLLTKKCLCSKVNLNGRPKQNKRKNYCFKQESHPENFVFVAIYLENPSNPTKSPDEKQIITVGTFPPGKEDLIFVMNSSASLFSSTFILLLSAFSNSSH